MVHPVLACFESYTNERVHRQTTEAQRIRGYFSIIDKLFPTLQATDRILNVFQKPFFSCRRSKNLKDLLVQTTPKYLGPPNQPETHPCKDPRCKTCPLVKTGDSFLLPCPPGHYTCMSTNVIFVITCTACTALSWAYAERFWGGFTKCSWGSGGAVSPPAGSGGGSPEDFEINAFQRLRTPVSLSFLSQCC